jgi:uncharacterized protein YdaU (DUF1376 family)
MGNPAIRLGGGIVAEFPALPLWTDAYLADTRHLSTVEHGAYLLLLMTAWRSPDCRLPDDDKKLARWAGLDMRRWQQIKPTIMQFWCLEAGWWTQKRLSKEAVWVRRNAEANRERAAAGGRAKALKSAGQDLLEAGSEHALSVLPTPTPTKEVIPLDKSNGAIDPAKVMFDAGRALLSEAGVPAAKQGALLGKWRRDNGDEALIAAIGKAKREGAVDPISFIEGCFRARRVNGGTSLHDTAPAL